MLWETSPAKNNTAMGILRLPIKTVDTSIMTMEYMYGSRLFDLRVIGIKFWIEKLTIGLHESIILA